MTADRSEETTAGRADTLMWEARAEPRRRDELLAWVEQQALPELAAAPGFLGAEIYRGGQERVVVIIRFNAGHSPVRLPDPPPGVVTRPAHQWPFRFERSM